MFSHDTLDHFPKVSLLDDATPIQRLERLEQTLGLPAKDIQLFVKRDDFNSLGGGGNKLRKLEFIVGDALHRGADTVVAVGGLQSNFARLTAAVCAKLGLQCDLVLTSPTSSMPNDFARNGNMVLDHILGAHIHIVPTGITGREFAHEIAAKLSRRGCNPYLVELGGSSPIGALGYALCAFEIESQILALGQSVSSIVLPNGSSGTHAGLAAGMYLAGKNPALIKAFSVLAPKEIAHAVTVEKTQAVLKLLGSSVEANPMDIEISDEQLGDGYGIPTDAMKAAVHQMARTEGLFLDPVYGGKAFAGLLSDLSSGHYQSGERILFLMTGGSPGIFAYANHFLDEPASD